MADKYWLGDGGADTDITNASNYSASLSAGDHVVYGQDSVNVVGSLTTLLAKVSVTDQFSGTFGVPGGAAVALKTDVFEWAGQGGGHVNLEDGQGAGTSTTVIIRGQAKQNASNNFDGADTLHLGSTTTDDMKIYAYGGTTRVKTGSRPTTVECYGDAVVEIEDTQTGMTHVYAGESSRVDLYEEPSTELRLNGGTVNDHTDGTMALVEHDAGHWKWYGVGTVTQWNPRGGSTSNFSKGVRTVTNEVIMRGGAHDFANGAANPTFSNGIEVRSEQVSLNVGPNTDVTYAYAA